MQLLLLSSALAAPVEVWSYADFEEGAINGVDDWRSGYREDDWYGYEGYALPLTDDGGEQWGDSRDGINNWLVNPAQDVGDGVFEAYFYSEDDDPIGLVVSFDDGSYYLFVLCGAADGPDPDCPLAGRPFSGIVYVDDDDAEVLTESRDSFSHGSDGVLSVSINDGLVEATSTSGDVALSVQDDAAARVNGVGFWAYNAGVGEDQSSLVAFGEAVLYAHDDDDDGIVDDEDNCEFAANEAQDDADGDGTGDVCDETPGTGDTDDGDDGDDGVDLGDGADEEGGITTQGSCGCDGGATRAAGLLTLLGLATSTRRRRAG